MAEENGGLRFSWSDKQEIGKLRSDHESGYREFRSYRDATDRRFERIEDEMRAMIPIPSQIKGLTESLDKLTEKIDAVITNSGASRRADWQLALTVLGLAAMTIFTVARGFH